MLRAQSSCAMSHRSTCLSALLLWFLGLSSSDVCADSHTHVSFSPLPNSVCGVRCCGGPWIVSLQQRDSFEGCTLKTMVNHWKDPTAILYFRRRNGQGNITCICCPLFARCHRGGHCQAPTAFFGFLTAELPRRMYPNCDVYLERICCVLPS